MQSLVGGRVLTRNVLLNVVGQGVPLLAAVLTFPALLAVIGVERFGFLAIMWMAIGYFGILDLGVGRALTQQVAERLGTGDREALPVLVWTALAVLTVLGIFAACVVVAVKPWLISDAMRIPSHLRAQSEIAVDLLAVSVPLVITSTGLRGVLEALQRFDLLNLLRAPLGVFQFVGPLAASLVSVELPIIVFPLVAARAIYSVVLYLAVIRSIPGLRKGVIVDRSLIAPLLRFGGWTTLSNILVPLMVNLDRFVIAALVSVAAVTFYVTPFEVVTKLWIVVGAASAVLFPAFATTSRLEGGQIQTLYVRSLRYIAAGLVPPTLLAVGLAPELLLVWLGPEFANASATPMRMLALGVLYSGLALMPYSLLQGMGRPRPVALTHLIELPIFLIATVWATSAFGIVGTATVWSIRAFIDACVMFALADRAAGGPASLPAILGLMVMAGLFGSFAILGQVSATTHPVYVAAGCGLISAAALYALVTRELWDRRARSLVRSR